MGRRAGEISGIMLAIMIPLLIVAFFCCRRQRQRHKMGLENKTLKKLTTSRHSLNDTLSAKTSASAMEPKWSPVTNAAAKTDAPSSGIGSITHSDLVPSSPPGADRHAKSTPPNTTTTASSPVGSQSSPTVSDTPSSGSTSATSGKRHKCYDGVYYTHEPIKGAPIVEFEDKLMDVEINHRNTEV